MIDASEPIALQAIGERDSLAHTVIVLEEQGFLFDAVSFEDLTTHHPVTHPRVFEAELPGRPVRHIELAVRASRHDESTKKRRREMLGDLLSQFLAWAILIAPIDVE